MSYAIHRLPVQASKRSRSALFPNTLSRLSTNVAATDLVLRTARAVGGESERTDAAFISATRLYEDCHWEFAFERIALLADQGHTPAAKLALLMLRYGRALYGTNFVAHPGQVARWAQRVLRHNSPPAGPPSFGAAFG